MGGPRTTLAAVVLVAGCAAKEQASAVAPLSSVTSIASAPSSQPAASASATSAAPEPPQEEEEHYEPPHFAFRWERRYPDEAAVDPKAWALAHGIKTVPKESPCWDVGEQVGVPKAPGLLCKTIIGDVPRKEAVLYRLDEKRLVVVWRALVAAWANWLDLSPTLAEDGTSLTLQDGQDCLGAAREHRAKEADGIGVRGLTKVLFEACAGIGTYTWNGRRYVLRAPAKKE
jgi:hypothetical protein